MKKVGLKICLALVIALSLIIGSSLIASAKAPVDGSIFFGGHYYKVVQTPPTSPVTWEEAKAEAEEYEIEVNGRTFYGHLVTITSEGESKFIDKLIGLQPVDPPSAFIGGYQENNSPSTDSNWYWVNDEGAFKYTNWNENDGEPNDWDHNGNGNDGEDNDENRLELILETGLWNDVPGTPAGDCYILELEPLLPVPDID